LGYHFAGARFLRCVEASDDGIPIGKTAKESTRYRTLKRAEQKTDRGQGLPDPKAQNNSYMTKRAIGTAGDEGEQMRQIERDLDCRLTREVRAIAETVSKTVPDALFEFPRFTPGILRQRVRRSK
jgi:hypothetical protein